MHRGRGSPHDQGIPSRSRNCIVFRVQIYGRNWSFAIYPAQKEGKYLPGLLKIETGAVGCAEYFISRGRRRAAGQEINHSQRCVDFHTAVICSQRLHVAARPDGGNEKVGRLERVRHLQRRFPRAFTAQRPQLEDGEDCSGNNGQCGKKAEDGRNWHTTGVPLVAADVLKGDEPCAVVVSGARTGAPQQTRRAA